MVALSAATTVRQIFLLVPDASLTWVIRLKVDGPCCPVLLQLHLIFLLPEGSADAHVVSQLVVGPQLRLEMQPLVDLPDDLATCHAGGEWIVERVAIHVHEGTSLGHIFVGQAPEFRQEQKLLQ